MFAYDRWRAKTFIPDDRTDCWLWTATINNCGYGLIWSNRRPVCAHRWSYEYFRGPIAHGMVIDHLCSIRACQNPDHLEVVTQKENVRRCLIQKNAKL